MVGLENLYRRARRIQREQWAELMVDFLTAVSSAEEADSLLADLSAVADRLLVRLGPPLRPPAEDARVWSKPLDETGLCVNLVVDYPERMCYVTEKLLGDSGRPGEEWLELDLFHPALSG